MWTYLCKGANVILCETFQWYLFWMWIWCLIGSDSCFEAKPWLLVDVRHFILEDQISIFTTVNMYKSIMNRMRKVKTFPHVSPQVFYSLFELFYSSLYWSLLLFMYLLFSSSVCALVLFLFSLKGELSVPVLWQFLCVHVWAECVLIPKVFLKKQMVC